MKVKLRKVKLRETHGKTQMFVMMTKAWVVSASVNDMGPMAFRYQHPQQPASRNRSES